MKNYSGVIVPMASPFSTNGEVDIEAAGIITRHLISHKAHPFVLGTTGEAASVPRSERIKLIRAVASACSPKTVLYAGLSGNSLNDIVEEAKAFADNGAEALVSTMPSYYPVDERQMLIYFEKLADLVPLPLIIYNIPATTHLSIPLKVMKTLCKHSNIVGFKDSEKSEERIEEATSIWKDDFSFSYLLGWAAKSYKALSLGADGVVPSTGNFSPGIYQQICEFTRSGDTEKAMLAQEKADALSAFYQNGRTLSHSLSALKAIMAGYGLCTSQVLPPLLPMSGEEQERLINEIKSTYGELNQLNTI